jgi:hypothetical protein
MNCSRSSSPLPSNDTRTRTTNWSTFNTAFLLPRPASSPVSSPDSLWHFQMCLSSPVRPYLNLIRAQGRNANPSTSNLDNGGFAFPSPRFNPQRAAIQSLAFNFTSEHVDSAPDSDSEWYHRILSAIATHRLLAIQPSRPDSTFLLPIASQLATPFIPRVSTKAVLSSPDSLLCPSRLSLNNPVHLLLAPLPKSLLLTSHTHISALCHDVNSTIFPHFDQPCAKS